MKNTTTPSPTSMIGKIQRLLVKAYNEGKAKRVIKK